MLFDALAQAERFVREGEEVVAEQHEKVSRLQGYALADAELTLRQLEELQRQQVGYRDRLRVRLADSP